VFVGEENSQKDAGGGGEAENEEENDEGEKAMGDDEGEKVEMGEELGDPIVGDMQWNSSLSW
jgi:hypothetical protein